MILSRSSWLWLLPLLGIFLNVKHEVTAFSSVSCRSSRSCSITRVAGNTRQQPDFPPPRRTNYGEESRIYRRTIYTHDDWVRHRSPTRFFQRAMTTLKSGIYANILRPVLLTTAVAAVVVIWNHLTGIGGRTFTSLPQLVLPMAPFTLSSASLGLLLVFRTNTGYSRWDEARKAWGLNINRTRDLLRMAVAWYDDTETTTVEDGDECQTTNRRQEDLMTLAKCTWAFVRCMKRHLSPADDEADFLKEIFEKLPEQQAQAILDAKHRPNRALFDLSVAIENLPMHFLRKGQLHMALTMFEDNLGASERLLSSPVPLFYSRHTARFLLFWTTLLPFAMYSQFNGVLLIPATFFMSTFLYGIEELANQMEEPFTILPMQAFCDRIYQWCMEITTWKPGDNGMTIIDRNDYQDKSYLDASYSIK